VLFNFRLFSRVLYAIAILGLIIVIGTVGYMVVEGWGLLDSFFMTIITVSTVGFHEVQPLSDLGQIFTAFLIITSFGTFAYAISAITTYLVGGEYKKYFIEYKLNKELEKLENHVIVCGYGRVGKQAVVELKAYGQQFLVVEQNPALIEKHSGDQDVVFLEGDATAEDLLEKAGIDGAKAIIVTLPKDADNLFAVLTARELNPKLKIISRASSRSSINKLKFAGADNVIMPDGIGGAHMASLVITPDVIEFLDHISIHGDTDINLEEISFSKLPPDFQYKTIGELNARKITGCNIIGYKTAGGDYVINPSPDLEVIPNSKLFVLGSPNQIQSLNKILGVQPAHID
jgi:voltage-gated potassium channel